MSGAGPALRYLPLVALLLAGCVVDAAANPNRCGDQDGCPAGQRCHRPSGSSLGFCVPEPDAGCVSMGDERCNGLDDDCDGDVDEDFDLRSAATCGACDVRCEGANPDCVPDGRGGYACGAGCPFSMCPSGCVDLQRDRTNCGACALRCDAGEDCDAGGCRCGGTGEDCGGGTTSTCCGTQCVDLNTSSAHCGGCGRACPSGSTCVDQQCRCGTAGTMDCRGPSTCVGSLCVL